MTVLEEMRQTGVADQLLCANARMVRAIGEALEREAGLAIGWYLALSALDRREGGYMKMSELAAHVSLTTSGTTRIVDRIADAGYVERKDCAADRRVSYCTLTSAGTDALRRAEPVYERAVRDYFGSRLEPDELRDFGRLVAKLHG